MGAGVCQALITGALIPWLASKMAQGAWISDKVSVASGMGGGGVRDMRLTLGNSHPWTNTSVGGNF